MTAAASRVPRSAPRSAALLVAGLTAVAIAVGACSPEAPRGSGAASPSGSAVGSDPSGRPGDRPTAARPGDGPAATWPGDRGRTRVSVTTGVETPALYDDEAGRSSSGDDPAIWVHPDDPARSLVVVTAKEGGLRVYDMSAREVQDVPAAPAPSAEHRPGRYNNVDLAYDVALGGERVDLAVVSDRGHDTIRTFVVDPAGTAADVPLTEVSAPRQDFLFNDTQAQVDEQATAYGLAVWQPGDGETYAVVTQADTTTVGVFRLVEADGRIGYEPAGSIDLPTTFSLPDGSSWVPCDELGGLPFLEGVVVDQRTGVLYAAQEDVGLWRIDLPLTDATEPELVDVVTDYGVPAVHDEDAGGCVTDGADPGYGGELLAADVEGVDIYYGPGETGYLVVSSQGDSTFAVYERQDGNAPVGSFEVLGTGSADQVDGSDGLAVTNRPAGPGYEQGLLVTHDEPETPDGGRDATNFSYVPWGKVAEALGLQSSTVASNDPRF